MFKLIKTVAEKLINSWQRTKQTKMNRGTTKTGDGQITPTGGLIAYKLPQKGAEAIRISDSKGQSKSADAREDESVDYSASGKSRQGETGNTEICQILVNRLNRDRTNWGTPIDVTKILGRRKGDIDCEARDGKKVLKIQVTKVPHDTEFWEKLNTLNEVSGSETFEELADALKGAIEAKANKYPSQQKKELILALDATDTPGYAFQLVIDLFHNRHGDWAVEQGFLGIWVVGPNERLTSRLDEQVHP